MAYGDNELDGQLGLFSMFSMGDSALNRVFGLYTSNTEDKKGTLQLGAYTQDAFKGDIT